MSNTYFVSDFHFWHTAILKYSSRNFSSVEDMNEALVNNWNAIVKPEDLVYDLGDVSFGKYTETKMLLQRLNGKHHIILGNHDKVIINNKNEFINSGVIASIQDYKELKIKGIPPIIMMHYPLRSWNKMHYGSIMLHGHTHNSLKPIGKSVDVGVDSKYIHDEYRPTSLEEVLNYMKDRQFEAVDHHAPKNEEDGYE